jgi:RNA polymerase sigma-70 factor (ECF subfamily)
MFAAVTPEQRPHEDRRECEARTLGDLLYANKAKATVSEKEWVRLIRSIAGGDQLALHELYTQTHRIVLTLIVRITRNMETAEELTLDVFHDVRRRAATYDPANGTVVGWIMNQARSRAIDRLRFEQAASDPQKGRLLRHALQVLTPEERQTLETAFFSGLTYREVAAKFDQPLGTVKTRIRSGLGKLREALAGTLKRP